MTTTKSHLGAPKPSHVAPSGGLRVLPDRNTSEFILIEKAGKENDIAATVFYTLFFEKNDKCGMTS